MSTPGRRPILPKTVWVLGAGFSRSLGGPLLCDFFKGGLGEQLGNVTSDPERARRIKERCAELGRAYGLNDVTPDVPRNLPWSDPEAFVAYVASAKGRSPDEDKRARLLAKRVNTRSMDVDTLGIACRNYLALACWEFWHAGDYESELWAPYVRWAKLLPKHGHTVVSFNYDEVCECAARQGSNAWLAAPPSGLPLDAGSGSLMLKLHGSCLWRFPEDPSLAAVTGQDPVELLDAFLATEPGEAAKYEAAIGVPGPDKAALANDRFGALWWNAQERLEEAHTIVFIGYSMPKSDNDAKARILGTIQANVAHNHYLSIHIVLGPSDTHGAVARLVGMLEWALAGRQVFTDAQQFYDARDERMAKALARGVKAVDRQREMFNEEPPLAYVKVHRLYAEDFLTVVDIDRLDLFAEWRKKRARLLPSG